MACARPLVEGSRRGDREPARPARERRQRPARPRPPPALAARAAAVRVDHGTRRRRLPLTNDVLLCPLGGAGAVVRRAHPRVAPAARGAGAPAQAVETGEPLAAVHHAYRRAGTASPWVPSVADRAAVGRPRYARIGTTDRPSTSPCAPVRWW
jgi:hypothetical protein